MKKTVVIAAILCCLITACSAPPSPSSQSAPSSPDISSSQSGENTPQDNTPQDSLPDLSGYGLLGNLIQDLNDPQVTLEVSGSICQENQYVNATPELCAQLSRQFMEHLAEQSVPPQSDLMDFQEDSLYFNLRKGDDFLSASLALTMPDDAEHPDMLFVELGDSNGALEHYYFDRSVFDGIWKQVSEKVEDLRVALEGEYRLMRPAEDAQDAIVNDVLEIGNTAVLSWYDQMAENALSNWTIETFDLTTGERLAQYKQPERIYRIEKSGVELGFDYRIFTANAVVYKNSGDAEKSHTVSLPASVQPFQRDGMFPGNGAFDLSANAFVWSAQDGVWLADTDGSNPKKLLSNDALPAQLQSASGGAYAYSMPRFLCNGTKVAASIYTADQADGQNYAGAAVYDIASGEISYLKLGEATHGQYVYPVGDRYVVSKRDDGTDLLDAQTGEATSLPIQTSFLSGYDTFDFQTLILWESGNPYGFSTWVCDAKNPADRSQPLLATANTQIPGRLLGVTENYAVFTGEDSDGTWLAASKYRQ